jgi:hypothetical protein
MSVNPRSITDAERPFLASGLTVEDQADLIDRVRELGYAEQIGLSLAGWLAGKAAGRPDGTSATTRATYRRILQEVRDAAARVGGAIPGYLKAADQAA